jgi:hypothetical protein
MIDQRMEGARPYILAADEAQPIETLVVGEAGNSVSGHIMLAIHAGDAARGAAETLMKRLPLPQAFIIPQLWRENNCDPETSVAGVGLSAPSMAARRWAGRAIARRALQAKAHCARDDAANRNR